MNSVEIRRPRFEDMEELIQLFHIVIKDVFDREGLDEEIVDEIERQVEEKTEHLKSDLSSNGEKQYFLVALDNDKIVGTIQFGPSTDLIRSCVDSISKDMIELGSLLIHPDYQQCGIGNLLLNLMYFALGNKGIEEFCCASGYPTAQNIWRRKFGTPSYCLKDYWETGYDYLIWIRKVSDIKIVFKT